ncbi:hypothetical protein DUNSADRAFT_6332, partial [Dunaliella salina]
LPASSTFVPVSRFSEYKACPDASAEGKLCEPGAVAFNGDGRNLSSQVLACPPRSCISNPSACTASSRFDIGGLQACPMNTSAEVGTVFELPFVVFDAYNQTAQAERLVEIADPCRSSAGSFYCDGRCFEVNCSLLDQLQGPEERAPRLRLLFFQEKPPGNETLKQLPYGWEDAIPVVGSGSVGQPSSSNGGRRRLLQYDDDGAETSLDGRVLNIAYGYSARDPGLEGIAWSNPSVAPCSSDGVRECGVTASDSQVKISLQKFVE